MSRCARRSSATAGLRGEAGPRALRMSTMSHRACSSRGRCDHAPSSVRAGPSLVDVLDRVLDKGIVIDAWVRVSLVGIELVTVEARVVVASISTYLGYAPALADLKPIAATTAQEPSLNGHYPAA